MMCLTETQTDPQQSVVVESDDQLPGCEVKSEARIFLQILNQFNVNADLAATTNFLLQLTADLHHENIKDLCR